MTLQSLHTVPASFGGLTSKIREPVGGASLSRMEALTHLEMDLSWCQKTLSDLGKFEVGKGALRQRCGWKPAQVQPAPNNRAETDAVLLTLVSFVLDEIEVFVDSNQNVTGPLLRGGRLASTSTC